MSIAKLWPAVLMLAGNAIAGPALGDTLKVGLAQTYKIPSAAAAGARSGDHIDFHPCGGRHSTDAGDHDHQQQSQQ
jgi:hypothetical protein